jgi:hypothetical protein
LEINPNYAEAHYNLGIALLQIGRLNEAVSHYNKAFFLRALIHCADEQNIPTKLNLRLLTIQMPSVAGCTPNSVVNDVAWPMRLGFEHGLTLIEHGFGVAEDTGSAVTITISEHVHRCRL